MISFILNRLAYGTLVIVLVVIIISSIIYLAPVDPTRLSFGQRSDLETVEAKKKQFGLDKPLSTQLRYYLRDISPIAIVPQELWNQNVYKGIAFEMTESKVLCIKTPEKSLRRALRHCNAFQNH